jgi:zinc protease
MAVAIAALSALPLPAAAQMFNPTTYLLDNGLTLVVVENHRAPIATHMVWYKVGAADEVPGKTGLAHLLEHLMFKGTPTVPAGQFSRAIARTGGRDNAFTSSDLTGYFQNLAADQLELAMRLEADRMRNLTPDEASFATERAVVLEERRTRTDNNPSALLNEQMEAALFLNHPYRRPVIGWASELAALSHQDAIDFYRKWYAPNNAFVIVVGDVKPEQVKALADKHYGPLPRAEVPPRMRLQEPPQGAARVVTLRDARVAQPSFSRYYLAPSRHYGDAQVGPRDSSYALEVLAEILGSGATSRLYKSLVVTQGLAASASAAYEASGWDYSTFSVSAMPRPGVPLDKVRAAIDAELARALKDGVSEAEVERAKRRIKASVAYARDSLHTAAHVLGEALVSGQTVADVEEWPQRIAAVTAEQVNAAARTVLDERRSVTGLLLADGEGRSAAPQPSAPVKPAREIR